MLDWFLEHDDHHLIFAPHVMLFERPFVVTIDNPFNSASNSFSFGNPFLITGEQVVTPIRPRTATLRISAEF